MEPHIEYHVLGSTLRGSASLSLRQPPSTARALMRVLSLSLKKIKKYRKKKLFKSCVQKYIK